ncbi:MAG: DUF3100 domain-containing protein [Hyphomicrobiales bacterium]
MNVFAKQIKLWRLYLAVIIVGIIAKWIGVREIPFGSGVIILAPLLFAFILAALINPNVTRVFSRFIRRDDAAAASSLIILAIMPFVAKLGIAVGPAIETLVRVGPALLLQELGALGGIVLAFPLGVWGFKMGREAIGATFSIAREPSLTTIAECYGLKSAEGAGVISIYVLGTLFGAFIFTILASAFASSGVFDPRALAMGCGVGSGSMMAACTGSLSEAMPRLQSEITAFASASIFLTNIIGFSIVGPFITLPILEKLYPAMLSSGVRRRREGERAIILNKVSAGAARPRKKIGFFDYAFMLAIICVVGVIVNAVATSLPLADSVTGMAVIALITMAGLLLAWFAPLRLPNLPWTSPIWILLVGILVTLPWTPGSHWVVAQVRQIDFLSLATPLLGFAGLAITGGEIAVVKKAGWRLALVACLVFSGTYVGSVLIAQLVLHWQGL